MIAKFFFSFDRTSVRYALSVAFGKAILLAAFLLALVPDASAQLINLHFSAGTNYTGNSETSPATTNAAAGTWNNITTIAADQDVAVSYADGSSGPTLSFDAGINGSWTSTSFTTATVNYTTVGGVYVVTNLYEAGFINSGNSTFGLRIKGLAAGTYKVNAVPMFRSAQAAGVYADATVHTYIGTGNDTDARGVGNFTLVATNANPTQNIDTRFTSWIPATDGSTAYNYVTATVTIDDTNRWLTLLFEDSSSSPDRPGPSVIQIVAAGQINTNIPPSISIDPHDASAYTNQSANFSVVASGTAPLFYQWYFNTNTILFGATNSTLTLTNLQTTNSGAYFCVVTNSFGSDTSAVAQLTVTVPIAPTITSQPQNQIVFPGAGASFSVSANGSMPLNFQWYFNTNTLIAGANNPTFTLNNVQATNAGTYSVAVNNLAGSTNSAFAVLTLNNSPVAPSFISQPASVVALAGSTAGFSASVSGTAPIYFQWRKNGSPISGATNTTLTLTNVQNSDAATYSLFASNSISTATSSNATLTITVASSLPNSAFNLTGFGGNTTGGGFILETDPAYRKVTNALDLANALLSAYKTAGSVKVIEITTNMDLGWNEVGSNVQNLASTPFNPHNPPQLHPRLLVTGVSVIDIKPRSGLTIFSANGATIRHATFNIKGTANIIVRNLKFDEMWEWDEATKGQYDKNDWDFIDLGNGGSVSNIWIDHCTFTKTYDGILDTKAGCSAITISWCKYVGDDGATNTNSFVWQQINSLESSLATGTNKFYSFLRNNGYSPLDIVTIIQAHDKTHLAGQNDLDPNNATLSMTFHHLQINGVWDRCVPRLRAGNVHDYNNYVDDTLVYAAKNLRDTRAAAMNTANQNTLNNTYSFNPPINGAISTEGGALLVEKSAYINCLTPLRNNQTDPSNPEYTGKILALDTIYQLNGASFRGNSTDPGGTNTLGPVQAPVIPFSWNTNASTPNGVLPYTYTLDDPSQLQSIVNAGAGASTVNWDKTNWLLTTYAPTAPVITAQPQNLTLPTNNSAAFTVVVSGSAPLSYRWYFNTNTFLPGATNSTLSLANIQSTNAGNYFAVISNSAGSVTSSVAALNIGSSATGFAAWQAANFTPQQLSDPNISGPGATPANDSVPNLVKYALGIPPFTPAKNSQLTSIVFTNGAWSLLYRRPAGASDIVYDPQTSTDLFKWTNSGVIQQLLGTDTNSLQIWGASYNGTPTPVRFYQLQLHQ